MSKAKLYVKNAFLDLSEEERLGMLKPHPGDKIPREQTPYSIFGDTEKNSGARLGDAYDSSWLDYQKNPENYTELASFIERDENTQNLRLFVTKSVSNEIDVWRGENILNALETKSD
jgi:hypothetical protein